MEKQDICSINGTSEPHQNANENVKHKLSSTLLKDVLDKAFHGSMTNFHMAIPETIFWISSLDINI